MRTLWRAVGVMLVLAMVGLSCRMNWRFGYSLGVTEGDALTFGAVSVVADLLKATLPLFVIWAWEDKRRMGALAGAVIFTVCLLYSVASSVGFGAENRGGLASSRENLNAALSDAQRDDKEARTRLASLPTHRPAGVIAGEVAALKKDRAFDLSKSCTDATAPASRDLCKQIERLNGESAAAAEAAVLTQKIERLALDVKRLRDKGAGTESDPQASAIARLTAFDVPMVRTGLAVLLAIVVEGVSSLGLFVVAGGHGTWSRKREAQPAANPLHASTIIDGNALAVEEAPRVDPLPLVRAWFLDRIVITDDGSVSLKTLEADFQRWCEQQRTDAPTPADFRALFARACVIVDRTMDRGRVNGMRLAEHQAMLTAGE